MTAHETLADLARRVQRLSPDRRDPEKYHCEKSEIAAELRRLAGQQSPAVIHKYSHKYTSLTHSDVK